MVVLVYDKPDLLLDFADSPGKDVLLLADGHLHHLVLDTGVLQGFFLVPELSLLFLQQVQKG